MSKRCQKCRKQSDRLIKGICKSCYNTKYYYNTFKTEQFHKNLKNLKKNIDIDTQNRLSSSYET